MAQLALANAFELLDTLDRPVTLTRAYHLLTSDRILREALDELVQRPATEVLIQLADFFHSTFVDAKAPEQREGIEGTVKTYLGFCLDPDIAAVFSSDEPMLIIHDKELDPGKLDFAGDHPQLVPWEMGGSQREKMLTSFVKLAPYAVETEFWIKQSTSIAGQTQAQSYSPPNCGTATTSYLTAGGIQNPDLGSAPTRCRVLRLIGAAQGISSWSRPWVSQMISRGL